MSRNKIINGAIFASSVVCLIISYKLFLNLGIYVDEYNTSPDVVLGGEFWLYMNWLKLGLSMLICVLSSINLFKAEN